MQGYYWRMLVSLLMFLCSYASSAQDRIYTRRGRIIEGRVKSVGRFWLRYYSEAADSTLHHKDLHYIDSISYSDGHYWRQRMSKADLAMERKTNAERLRAKQLTGMANALNADIVYMDIARYPGIVVGLSYERFLDRRGKYSASLAVSRYWAGTASGGKLSVNEERANIQGGYLMPAFLYHTSTAGNANYIDLSFGAAFPIGNVLRYDVTYGTSSYPYKYSERTTNMLVAALLQANFCLHLGGHFIFTTTVSSGPMLDAANTRGSLWLAGFKFGARF